MRAALYPCLGVCLIACTIVGATYPYASAAKNRGVPTLTAQQEDAVREHFQPCWNVVGLSDDAMGLTVTVAASLSKDGTVVEKSVRLAEFDEGPDAAVREAYQSARRAIIRCGSREIKLPLEKYDHWRDIELKFDPKGMRIK